MTDAFPLDEERAAVLARFTAYTARLAPPLRTLALSTATYLGEREGDADAPLGLSQGVSVMADLPYHFRDAFPVGAERLRDIAYCSLVGTLYALAIDKIVDGETEATAAHHFLVSLLYGELQRALLAAVGTDLRFWTRYDAYVRVYHAAETGPGPNSGDSAFDADDYRARAQARSAPVKFIVVALACAADRTALIDSYCESIDRFLVGFQLYDDALDWREDLAAGRLTPATAPLHGDAGVAYASDVLERVLDESCAWFEAAAEPVADQPCAAWKALLARLAASTRGVIRDMVEAKLVAMLSAATPVPPPGPAA